MKTFNQYVNEETMPFAQTDSGLIGIEDPAVRDNINTLIDGVTSKGFITPYIGLERISKVLANFHIFLPKYTFADGDEGVTTFEINQFGSKIGMNNDGQMVTKESSTYYLYFEYRADDEGMFGVFSSVVTEDELDELMSDYEDEEDEEEINEEKMTDTEMRKREKIVMSMKKNVSRFKDRYGDDAKSVMYATATKQAMAEEDDNGDDTHTKAEPHFKGKNTMSKSTSINEISKKFIGSYINRARKQKEYLASKKSSDASDMNNVRKRESGLTKAVDKLTKEESEQLDELSSKTLKSYIKKSTDDATNSGALQGRFSVAGEYARDPVMKSATKRLADRYLLKSKNRKKGIKQAVDKL